jgi:hypothetical protein
MKPASRSSSRSSAGARRTTWGREPFCPCRRPRPAPAPPTHARARSLGPLPAVDDAGGVLVQLVDSKGEPPEEVGLAVGVARRHLDLAHRPAGPQLRRHEFDHPRVVHPTHITALSLAITPQPRQSRPERLASRTTWKQAHYTASRHPHFEAAPEGARRRTCKGEQQRFPREDCRLSAYQAAEAYRLTACSGRLWRSENALPVNPPLYIFRRIGRVGRSLRLWMQACGQAFIF